MGARRGFAILWSAGLVAGILCAGCFAAVDAPTAAKSHKKSAKKPPLPPLPSGPQGPVPQISLDSMQAVAPHVTYEGGQLTIVAPNSTLADILRAVHKLTGAEMEIPAGATERVVTNIGPGPAPGVMADLLNGSRFNYVLLGSPSDPNTLTHVVLVPKGGPETASAAAATVANSVSPQPIVAQETPEAADADTTDDSADDSADQNSPEAEPGQQPANGDAAVKTPQQLLQEMQQRQLQMQQQQGATGAQPPGPGGVMQPPQRPPQPQPPQQEQ
ncbi:MAG TPA: hypothetical protein VIW68_09140 [Candidatus Sulfotelmatobacter sp.]